MQTQPVESNASVNFGGRVIKGSIWSTIQILLNKLATVGATILFAHYLSPADFGTANIATSLGAFAFVLAPWVFNDILIARPHDYSRLAGTAFWVSLAFGIISSAGLLALAPLFTDTHPTVDGLWGLLCVAATRPIADALLSVPWARMRLDLSYRKLAIIDGGLQLIWTAASVTMAIAGFRALVLVLPPIAVLLTRAGVYWILVGRKIPMRLRRTEVLPLCRVFLVATCGQYLNNIIQILELLVLQWLAPESTVGLFAFAFLLSSQTNAVIGAQISNVLQPVFSQIGHDTGRQISGFIRSIRYMGMFAVPISAIQAAVGPSLFAALFGPKWDGSAPAYLALCMAQGFMFLVGPSVVLLKAQGRFRAFFAWQSAQVVLSATTMILFVQLGTQPLTWLLNRLGITAPQECASALAISIASALVWAANCPIAMWLATRGSGVRTQDWVRVIAEPWIVSLPIAACVALTPRLLNTLIPAEASAWVCVLLIAPAGLLFAIVLLVRRDAAISSSFHAILFRLKLRCSNFA